MEVILEGSEGVPEGGVLSIKIGDTKRQSPVSKIGQPFRFASSPAEPLPLKVEVLMPAAPPQIVSIDPTKERFVVDFGKMKVNLRQIEAKELRRAPVNVAESASAGLPTDKLQVAKSAASYLEKHDLVRVFQDVLHALLISKPEDPWKYLDEHLLRAKALAQKTKEMNAMGEDSIDSDRQMSARSGEKRATVNRSRTSADRGSIASRSKVDALLTQLMATRKDVPSVLPFLPDDIQKMLVGKELDDECSKQFALLDKTGSGKLDHEAILPIIVQLSSARLGGIGSDQAKRFLKLFDANEDGYVCKDEFKSLVQFVLIVFYLETPEGKTKVEAAQIEEKKFAEFLAMIEKDRERLWEIIPFLPNDLVEHLTSEAFMRDCNERFKALDTNGSGQLEPMELIPVVRSLSEANPITIDLEKCKRFVKIFDVYQNGVIVQDEFVDFVQFLTVMNFLCNTQEGQALQSKQEAYAGIDAMIKSLEEDWKRFTEVLHQMPKVFVDEIMSRSFSEGCKIGFRNLDVNGNGVLDPVQLFPLIVELSAVHPFKVSTEQCKAFTTIFDKDRNGVISVDAFVDLARFIMVMAFLKYSKDHKEMLFAEVMLGQEKIDKLLMILRDSTSKIDEIIPFLPQDLKEELLGEDFALKCVQDFKSLDKDNSGVLEPKELLPIILALSDAHHFALTEQHCKHFVEIFDVQQNGVITREEFLNFARFMMIMAYMDTEEGSLVQQQIELIDSEQKVKDLLALLERDRDAVHKVVPMLPEHIFNYLISDDFVNQCRERFMQLDKDGNGVLDPGELLPIVVELSSAQTFAIDLEHCKQFTKIFDLRGDGVIRIDEFLDFARFLVIMGYLNSEEGRHEVANAMTIMSGHRQIDELLAMLRKDRQAIRKVIPYLPQWLQDDLLSEHFTLDCLEHFAKLDKDKSGSLEPAELFPVLLEISQVHQLSLSNEQCKKFTAIFDDEGTGVISKSEFVKFARFLMVCGYLQTEDGARMMQLASQEEKVAKDRKLQKSNEKKNLKSTEQVPVPPEEPYILVDETDVNALVEMHPQVGHIQVDADYFEEKTKKLKTENDLLRTQVNRIEAMMRDMQERLDEQDYRLRHNNVDLRSPRGVRPA